MGADTDRLAEIVGGETAGLCGAGDEALARTRLARMRAVIARLAAASLKGGAQALFRGKATAAGNDAAITAAILDGQAGSYGGRALPDAAVLWPIDTKNEPLGGAANLPPGAEWIADPNHVASTTDFTLGTGRSARCFRFYERAGASTEGPSYVSYLTGTGLPATAPRTRRLGLAWLLGTAAAVLFLFATITMVWTGRTLVDAYTLLTQPDTSFAALNAAREACVGADPDTDPATFRACAEAWRVKEVRDEWRKALAQAMVVSGSPDSLVGRIRANVGPYLTRAEKQAVAENAALTEELRGRGRRKAEGS